MQTGKTKILIVDDHPENITSLSHLIAADDIEIHSAAHAEGALDLLTRHEFALALFDVQMPGVSGFELARLVRGVKRFRNLPVIFVTAHQRDQSVIFEGYETGAVDLLFKPLDPHVVRTKVQAFVKLDQQSRLLQAQVDELKRLRLDAEAANVAKSRFLANMSHEIRTPLAAVLGFAEVLAQGVSSGAGGTERKSEGEADRLAADCMSAIKRNGDLLLRLIDDILDLSKIEAHGVTLEAIEFSLEELLNDVDSTLSFKAAEKGLSLKFTRLSALSQRYVSDPTRMKQVLLNVIGNAVKFTGKGTVEVSVKAEADDVGGETLSFQIKDDGVGLSQEQASRLFQPFSQADASTRRQFGGTGLGLVISREIALLMGGDLRLKSTSPGRGSTFEITFKVRTVVASHTTGHITDQITDQITGPTSEAHLAATPFSAPTAAVRPRSAKTLEGWSLLVVDDSLDNLTLIEHFLRPTGLRLRTATSGPEALLKFKEERPDVILMDVQMPGMDGLETTRLLREAGYSGQVIGHTAHAMKEEHDRCLAAGYNSVLTKPIDRQKLVARLETVLRVDDERHPVRSVSGRV